MSKKKNKIVMKLKQDNYVEECSIRVAFPFLISLELFLIKIFLNSRMLNFSAFFSETRIITISFKCSHSFDQLY